MEEEVGGTRGSVPVGHVLSLCALVCELAFSVKLGSWRVGGLGSSYSRMASEEKESTLLVGPVRKSWRRDFTWLGLSHAFIWDHFCCLGHSLTDPAQVTGHLHGGWAQVGRQDLLPKGSLGLIHCQKAKKYWLSQRRLKNNLIVSLTRTIISCLNWLARLFFKHIFTCVF